MADQDNTDDEPYYILVDFNGTLAKHDKGAKIFDDEGKPLIGEPIKRMVDRVRKRIDKGMRVKIQCGTVGAGGEKGAKMAEAIKAWAKEHIGHDLEVTGTITPRCLEVWNDKARKVVRNEGRFDGEADDDEPAEPAATAGGAQRVWRYGKWVEEP